MTARRDVGNGPRRPPILQSTLGTYGTQLLAASMQLLNVLIVARVLGPAGRGEVVFLSTIAYLTAQVAALGVHQAAANLAASRPSLRPALATNSIVFALLLGGIAAGLVHLLVVAFPAVAGGTDAFLRVVALAAVPVIVLEAYLSILVRTDYGFRVANAAIVIVPLTTACVNGVFALAGWLSIGTAFVVWVIAQVLAVLLLVVYMHRRLAGFGRPDPSLGVRCLAFGLKAHAARVMLVGNYKLDQWLVGAIAGKRELGLYSVAVTWFETLFYLPTALAAVQRPDLVRASPREAGRRTALAVRATALVTTAMAVVLVVAAPVLCAAFFGEEFRGAADDLRVLVPGAFGILALKLLGNALVAKGQPLLETAATGAAFAVTILLNVALVPGLGALGAAIASTAAYSVGGAVIIVLFRRAFGVRVSQLAPRGSEIPWFWRKVRLTFRQPAAVAEGEGKSTS